MPSTSAAYGLQPVFHPSGIIRPTRMTIASGYGTGILHNQPVKIHTDGTIVAAAVGDRFIGVFQGVTWVGTNGVPAISAQWTASTSAMSGTTVFCTVTMDPTITYKIQSSATLAIGVMGQQFDYGTITTGSTTTGLSAMTLNAASSAANAGLQVVGLVEAIDNAWDDTYVDLLVRISEHQLVADVAAF